MIEVRLFASFREGREKIMFVEPENFTTGQKLVDFLEISSEEVAIFLINGRHKKLCDSMKDKDIVCLFPPVGGG